jgi:hypothetical protein
MVVPSLGYGIDGLGDWYTTSFTKFVTGSGWRMAAQDVFDVHFYGGVASAMGTSVAAYADSASKWGYGQHEIWVTEMGSDGPSEQTSDSYQAEQVVDEYSIFMSSSTPKWTKLFKLGLARNPEWELVHNIFTNPVIRPAYHCYQALAFGYPLPNAC